MNAIESIRNELNTTSTENGAMAYRSTLNSVLDLFANGAAKRHYLTDVHDMFEKAFLENPALTLKCILYLRDIRTGCGERDVFRTCLKALFKDFQGKGENIIKYVPEYGRWDDLFVGIKTPAWKKIIPILKEQLESDVKSEHPSLLGKWLPSINASAIETRKLAKYLADSLNMKPAEYRRMCSQLREKIKIVENNLRTKTYDEIDYKSIPSQANMKYHSAFMRNDGTRYMKSLKKGEVKTGTLMPYQIVGKFLQGLPMYVVPNDVEILNSLWENLPRNSYKSKTLMVRDGSGSMYNGGLDSSIAIATSLTLLFSEQLEGPFKNTFITFSSRPQLVEIPANLTKLSDKLKWISKFNDCSNTDIDKVFNVIYNTAINSNISSEDMIKQVVIVSDMEFDCMNTCGKDNSTVFTHWKNKFESSGYKLPQITFWNTCARGMQVPVTKDENGVKLVSGNSAKVFDKVINSDPSQTPEEFMLEVLSQYPDMM